MFHRTSPPDRARIAVRPARWLRGTPTGDAIVRSFWRLERTARGRLGAEVCTRCDTIPARGGLIVITGQSGAELQTGTGLQVFSYPPLFDEPGAGRGHTPPSAAKSTADDRR